MSPIALYPPLSQPMVDRSSMSPSQEALLSTISELPHQFLQPSLTLHNASLSVAKGFLDPLAASTSKAQQDRQESSKRKRKRGRNHAYETIPPLAVKQLYLDGFDIAQIWQQAKRILDATHTELQDSVPNAASRQFNKAQPSAESEERYHNSAQSNNSGIGSQDSRAIDNDEAEAIDYESFEESGIEDEDFEMGEALDGFGQDVADEDGSIGLIDNEDDALEGSSGVQSEEDHGASEEIFKPDKLGLNDGFFSIDDFNRQSQFLEQQDIRGENQDDPSDEEEIEWDVDPLNAGLSKSVQPDQLQQDLHQDSSGDEDGPTFGNADLNEMTDSDEGGDADLDIMADGNDNAAQNTNDIRYADFFAPPPRKLTKSSRRRALPKTQPQVDPMAANEPVRDEVERTIASVRRDIFEDDLTEDEDPAEAAPEDRRSSHQKRQARLTEEIRKLEAAAVAKRDWTLSGEARAADRPLNSLLEQDVEFERTGKPVPVITQEVSEDIEALIKRRIIAREFDEVIRRRPGASADASSKGVRQGRVELDNGKPQQSLAEIYENEHLKAVNPEGYVDKRSEALKKEHAQIEKLWKETAAKLDALSSLHYKPKPAEISLNVVSDVPAITIEDARPNAGADAGQSMLAPQEIYQAGELGDKKAEITTKGGAPIRREEMSKDERVRRRRREKERIRKAGTGVQGKTNGEGPGKQGRRAKEKTNLVTDLTKGDVKVIGRKGEIRNAQGQMMKGGAPSSAKGAGFKL